MIPYNAPADEETALIVDTGESLDGSQAGCEILPACDQYTKQAEMFAQAILTGASLPYGIEDRLPPCVFLMRFLRVKSKKLGQCVIKSIDLHNHR